MLMVDPLYRSHDSMYKRSGWDMEVIEHTFDKFKTTYDDTLVSNEAWTIARNIMREEYRHTPRSVVSFAEIEKPTDKSPGWPGIEWFDTIEDFRSYVPLRTTKLWAAMGRDVVYTAAYAFIKDEPLRVDKIEKKDQRLILCWDDAFQMCKLRFQYHDHMIMKQHWADRESKMGWSPLLGGFHESVIHLTGYTHKVQEDFRRFDGTISADLMYEVYSMDWDNIGYQYKTHENVVRYYNVVHNSINTHEILPNGDVVRLNHGNKSGTADTTPLNAKVNTFLKAYEVAVHLLETGDIDDDTIDHIDGSFMRKHYAMITYGDDRLVGENIEIHPQRKEEIYKTLGIWLPQDKIVVSDRLDGLQFCGATVRYDQLTRRYYPCFGDSDKILDSFVWKNVDVVDKILNYALITYGGKHHKKFVDIARNVGVHLPSPQDMHKLFVG